MEVEDVITNKCEWDSTWRKRRHAPSDKFCCCRFWSCPRCVSACTCVHVCVSLSVCVCVWECDAPSAELGQLTAYSIGWRLGQRLSRQGEIAYFFVGFDDAASVPELRKCVGGRSRHEARGTRPTVVSVGSVGQCGGGGVWRGGGWLVCVSDAVCLCFTRRACCVSLALASYTFSLTLFSSLLLSPLLLLLLSLSLCAFLFLSFLFRLF